jgi:hypothetical protein
MMRAAWKAAHSTATYGEKGRTDDELEYVVGPVLEFGELAHDGEERAAPQHASFL